MIVYVSRNNWPNILYEGFQTLIIVEKGDQKSDQVLYRKKAQIGLKMFTCSLIHSLPSRPKILFLKVAVGYTKAS